MLGSYPNFTCSVDRSSGTNAQGEIGTFAEVAAALPIFLIYKGRQLESVRGWMRIFDALGYIDESNLDDYKPLVGDKLIFSNGTEYEIMRVQPLRGMGETHLGFRTELKTLTESGFLP